MAKQTLSVVVYCASSHAIDKKYMDAAAQLGKLLAENNMVCINGAGCQGLMGAVNDAVLLHGGTVKGIIPKFMVDNGWCHSNLTETIVTDTIHERKFKMAQLADAVIALPGGMGTLEELAEILTWKQLGLYENPIIILNINGYYDPLLAFLDKMMEEKFMNASYKEMWQVAATPHEALKLLNEFPQWNPQFTKYHKKEV